MADIKLSKIATRAPKGTDKDATKAKTKLLIDEIKVLQDVLIASGKKSMLVILQGMDASGKDGVTKNVFGGLNPIGIKVHSFKKPTEEEFAHDFLWRVHQVAPAKGEITIFNRSHYEDVLIQRVHKWVDESTIRQRFEQINNFEKMLVDNGTIVLKFYLHVSKEEQLLRLNERLNDATKMWKHNENDILERKYWNQYMKCYEDVFTNCSESVAWNIIPSDQNWYKEYLIAKKIVETLEALNMKFPGLKKEN